MLRLVHKQKGVGPLLVDDIDDGLPNKQVVRLNTANPYAYERDGYAQAPKQPCYIPYSQPGSPTTPGFIDLDETQRVKLSAFKGKIAGLKAAGLIDIISLVASDLATPAITNATVATGDVTITGTGFLSVSPVLTRVRLQGAGVGNVTLTQAQIVAVAPGAVGATSIVIDSTLIPGFVAGDTVTVIADGKTSNVQTV